MWVGCWEDNLRMETRDEPIVEKARAFAIAAHGGQLYGDRPYADHLAAVVQILRDHGYDDQSTWLAAGWLHDVIEDTPVILGDLENRFGGLVCAIVWACTGEGKTRAERNASIYAKLRTAPVAVPVKVADRIANIEAAPPGSPHAARYWREAAGFREAVEQHACPSMLQRLDRAHAAVAA